MNSYLMIPTKTTWEVDLITPIKTYLEDRYEGSAIAECDYERSLSEFQKLRNNMIAASANKCESSLEILEKYYDQLCAVDSRLPIAENEIRIKFKWQNAFDKDSFWSGKKTLIFSSAGYEKACVLFNIGAMMSHIAQNYDKSSDKGLKSAARMYQQAAGIYSYLQDSIMSYIQIRPTPDLQTDSHGALNALMVAQAQDCFYRKAVNDRMKSSVIAKVAFQCSVLYSTALKLLQVESVLKLWPKEWVPHISNKESTMQALAQFHQSEVHKAGKEFGLEIARLRLANTLIDSNRAVAVTAEIARKIQNALADAEKDNNFIYHATVPNEKDLPAIAPATLAKAIPLNHPISGSFKDLFAKIVPVTVYNALLNFDEMKASVVKKEVTKLRDATQLMNSVLASLNLPAAIEDFSGEAVPPSVLEKAQQVHADGGIVFLRAELQKMPDLLQRNKNIIEEAITALEEEERTDNQLKKQYKSRWERTESSKLNDPMKIEAAKHRSIIDNAIKADETVQQKFLEYEENIKLLSKSESEITRSIPSTNPAANLRDSPIVKELGKLIKQTNAIKSERDKLELDSKNIKIDMSAVFMAALGHDGILSNEKELGQQKLDEKFTPIRTKINKSIKDQETMMLQIQNANSKFCQQKVQSQSDCKREDVLKDLASGFDKFKELKNNIAEGTEFYKGANKILMKFKSKVDDFCYAREIERNELIAELEE